MARISLILLALCAGFPLLAQDSDALTVASASGKSSLTLYGTLDAGVAHVDHSMGFDPYTYQEVGSTVNAHATKGATGMYNSGISGSRWGLKGGTRIADGYQAMFLLESAIDLPDGAIANGAQGLALTKSTGSNNSADSALNGQLFSRGAYFGVMSDKYGTLTIGRHQSLMLDILVPYDTMQGANVFCAIVNSGSYGGGGATGNTRIDNSIRYKGHYGSFNFSLLHGFGGVSGISSAKSADQANVGYESGPFGVQLAYEGYKDALSLTNGATIGTIAATALDTKAYMLAAKYQMGALAIKGGTEREELTNPSNPSYDATLTSANGQVLSSVNVTAYTKNGKAMQKNLNVYWLGLAYDMTAHLNAAVSYYLVNQNNFANGLAAPGNASSGKSKFYSTLLDYRFNKAFDLYLASMTNVVSGGLASGFVFDTNTVYGLGARYSF